MVRATVIPVLLIGTATLVLLGLSATLLGLVGVAVLFAIIAVVGVCLCAWRLSGGGSEVQSFDAVDISGVLLLQTGAIVSLTALAIALDAVWIAVLTVVALLFVVRFYLRLRGLQRLRAQTGDSGSAPPPRDT